MPVTRLSDLAASLRLNIATVSRALRDDPRVKLETRERIRAEAERMGYRPHIAARALAEGRTRTVWFVLPNLEDSVAREPAWHASRFLLEQGYDLLLAQHHNDAEVYRRILDRLSRGGADAAILLPDASLDEGDSSLPQPLVPFVYLDRRLKGTQGAVTTDNHAAAAGLVNELAKRVRPDVVVNGFGAPHCNSVEVARREGVREAARACGLPVVDPDEAHAGVRPLVLASSEQACLALLKERSCTAAGLGVFDDWRSGPRPNTAILVAVQDFSSMARAAVESLLKQLKGEEPPTRDELVPLARTWAVE